MIGMVERRAKCAAIVSPDAKTGTLHQSRKEHILPTSTVYTDDYLSYGGISEEPRL